MKVKESEIVKLLIYNKSAINLGKHLIVRARSKHIETQSHFFQDQLNKRRMDLNYCRTNIQ
ncbi:hypothetical protein CR513_20902, partial [Mucuna pruriens]